MGRFRVKGLGFRSGSLNRRAVWRRLSREFAKIRGIFLGVSRDEDYRRLGSVLGSPYFGKLPLRSFGIGEIPEQPS